MRQETLLKIVGLMREDLDKGLTILGISKKLKIGYRPAYNHITGMEKEGIIFVKKIGNSKECLLNLESSRCRLILEEMDLLKKENLEKQSQKLKSILEGLTAKLTDSFASQIHSVVLFGSYARRTASKTSDIDLLFIICDLKDKETRRGIEQECASYQYSHSIKVSPLITNIAEFKKMIKAKELNVGKEIREYGISIYGSEAFWRIMA